MGYCYISAARFANWLLIIFSNHVRRKLEELDKFGFHVDERALKDAVTEPDSISESKSGLSVAQKVIDERHLMRVIYGRTIDNDIIVGGGTKENESKI